MYNIHTVVTLNTFSFSFHKTKALNHDQADNYFHFYNVQALASYNKINLIIIKEMNY